MSREPVQCMQLLIEPAGQVVRVTLNRPEVRNAFNEELIAEMTASTALLAGTPNGLSADTAPVSWVAGASSPPPAAHEASDPASGVIAAAASANFRNWRRWSGFLSIVIEMCAFRHRCAVTHMGCGTPEGVGPDRRVPRAVR